MVEMTFCLISNNISNLSLSILNMSFLLYMPIYYCDIHAYMKSSNFCHCILSLFEVFLPPQAIPLAEANPNLSQTVLSKNKRCIIAFDILLPFRRCHTSNRPHFPFSEDGLIRGGALYLYGVVVTIQYGGDKATC